MIRNAPLIAPFALALAGCAATPPPVAATPAVPAAPTAAAAPVLDGSSPAPDTMRYTYGSGEAAALSMQSWQALTDWAIAYAAAKPARSVAMGLPEVAGGIGSTDCAGKQPAAVFDVDETVILNRGAEYWSALGHPHNAAEWSEWANEGAPFVAPVPGAREGIARLREAGIAVIYNTNRRADTAAGTAAAIEAAGLGPAIHGDTLYLSGDDALGGNKDGRRQTIAARFCVVALGGDNLGDFANFFNDKSLSVQQRRGLVARADVARLWGRGWFALPNAAYGAWQFGTIDEVFPPEARWTPKTAPANGN